MCGCGNARNASTPQDVGLTAGCKRGNVQKTNTPQDVGLTAVFVQSTQHSSSPKYIDVCEEHEVSLRWINKYPDSSPYRCANCKKCVKTTNHLATQKAYYCPSCWEKDYTCSLSRSGHCWCSLSKSSQNNSSKCYACSNNATRYCKKCSWYSCYDHIKEPSTEQMIGWKCVFKACGKVELTGYKCPQCDFFVCDACKPLRKRRAECPNDHNLEWTENTIWPWCEYCGQETERGLTCACNFTVCNKCKSVLTTTKPSKNKQGIIVCQYAHPFVWKAQLCAALCDNCNTDNLVSGYQCQCYVILCEKCHPTNFASRACPNKHALKWGRLGSEEVCQKCKEKSDNGFKCECKFFICIECRRELKAEEVKQENAAKAAEEKKYVNECRVCRSAEANTRLDPCGHVPMCETCFQRIERKVCPQCNLEFTTGNKL